MTLFNLLLSPLFLSISTSLFAMDLDSEAKFFALSEQIYQAPTDMSWSKNDRYYFLDSGNGITLDGDISSGGSKTALKANTDEPGHWVVLQPNKCRNSATWLTIMKREKDAADQIRQSNKNMAQQFKWVVIEKPGTNQNELTLAAKNFQALATDENLYIYDHKNPLHGVFSRCLRFPLFSGVEEDLFFSDAFWQHMIDDMVATTNNGFPESFSNSDSINLSISLPIQGNKAALIAHPVDKNDRDDLKDLTYAFEPSLIPNLHSSAPRELAKRAGYLKELEQIKQDPEFREFFTETYGFNQERPKDCWIWAEDLSFDLLRGDFISIFLFDADVASDCKLVDKNDNKAVETLFAFILRNAVQNASAIFFPSSQWGTAEFREKESSLIEHLTNEASKKLYRLR